jgi:hypothetical protein
VPPVWEGDGPAITRKGEQITYVFFKDGVESFVIRPGFEGKVDEFGMLIPFPTPPALRKVEDEIFAQIAKAIDPPEVVIDVSHRVYEMARGGAVPSAAPAADGLAFREEVRVLKEEAVGMYQVAVLEAGSADALKRWLDDHDYRYPQGMGAVAQDYVNLGWCFVAVKTQVGQKRGVTPRPGMTEADEKLPAGSVFDGNVQAMGFRFTSPELVVPMRLSGFNAAPGETTARNIVYLLTEEPLKVAGLDADMVKRQLTGEQLFKNVTEPLPLRIIGGTVDDLSNWQRQGLPQRRDPRPHNAHARDLFAGDLLAAKLYADTGRLSLPYEETEKELLKIDERLGLRGKEIDALRAEALTRAREVAVDDSLASLKGMTLTVIDGDFPLEHLQAQNITFEPYRIEGQVNTPRVYDAKTKTETQPKAGRVYGGAARPTPPGKWLAMLVVLGIAVVGLLIGKRTGA